MIEAALEKKYHDLKEQIEDMGSVLVAFSGGVDSTLLLLVASEVLKDNCVAATINSPLHPRPSLQQAAAQAEVLGIEHITVDTDELDDEAFVANPPERCYLCKRDRYSKLVDIATREGIAEVIDGTQMDDTSEHRPGMEAAGELGVRSPLLEIGFQKYEVRALSRELGLSTWNMPPGTCLATRIPYSQRITPDKLDVIDRGERFLKEMGFSPVRLRFIEDRVARIEVSPDSVEELASDGVRERVVRKMEELGFLYVTADLAGYRSGALDEALR